MKGAQHCDVKVREAPPQKEQTVGVRQGFSIGFFS